MRFTNLLPVMLLSLACRGDIVTTTPVIDAPIVVPTLEIKPITLVSWKVPRHVLILGDSEACAVGLYVKDVVGQINASENQPVDVINVECKGGTTVPYWTTGKFKAALEKHPDTDTVLIFLGTNHYWNEKDTPDVGPIVDAVSDHGLNCIWVGNTAVHGKHWKINKLLRVAVTPACDYFDTEAADIPLQDGVHPGKVGAVKWLKAIWPLIPQRHEENDE